MDSSSLSRTFLWDSQFLIQSLGSALGSALLSSQPFVFAEAGHQFRGAPWLAVTLAVTLPYPWAASPRKTQGEMKRGM